MRVLVLSRFCLRRGGRPVYRPVKNRRSDSDRRFTNDTIPLAERNGTPASFHFWSSQRRGRERSAVSSRKRGRQINHQRAQPRRIIYLGEGCCFWYTLPTIFFSFPAHTQARARASAFKSMCTLWSRVVNWRANDVPTCFNLTFYIFLLFIRSSVVLC